MNAGAYVLVVFGILMAKCLGFVRDIVFASVFGASELTDIYFQVFSIASLVFTGIGSALSTLIIKNLNKPENAGSENQRRYVSHFITKTSAAMLVVTILLYVFSGSIVKVLLPGLNPHLFKTAVSLMHIMLPSCIFVIIAYIISGVLQNNKVFFITSVMSMPYNILIIASLFKSDISIETVSIITTIGWFLHIVVLLPPFYKKGFRLFGSLSSNIGRKDKNPEVLYIFIGSMMFQLCLIIDKAAVSFDSGMVSTLNYASNLFVTISSVFVVAMSNVSYPSICRHYENNNSEYVRSILGYIITILFAIFIPFILTANLFGKDIIALLYERGEFDSELTSITASLFSIYTFGIFGYVCQELFNKILYLGSKYQYPVAGTLIIVALKLLINAAVSKTGGAIAVALSTTVLFTLYAIGVSVAMGRVVGNYLNRTLAVNILKILLAAAVALAVYFVTAYLPFAFLHGKFAFLPRLAACGAAYIAVLFLTGSVKYIVQKQNIPIEKEEA